MQRANNQVVPHRPRRRSVRQRADIFRPGGHACLVTPWLVSVWCALAAKSKEVHRRFRINSRAETMVWQRG
jgi:hypothetical protein